MINNNVGKISIVLVIIFGFIGSSVMFAGISTIIQRMSYDETIGTYCYSREYITTDDDGFEHTRYRWYYNYYVDGIEHEVSSSGHSSEYPNVHEEAVLYNPNNPSESVMKNDNLGIAGICVGLIFALPPLMIYIKDKKSANDTVVNSQIRHERTMMWIFLLVFLGALFLIFSNSDFSLGTMWFPILFSLVFVVISGYVLLKSYITNEPVSSNNVTIRTLGKNGKTYHSFEEYQNDMMLEKDINKKSTNDIDGLNNDVVGPFFADDQNDINPISNSDGISYGYDDPKALINNENKYNRDDLERKTKKVINKASAVYLIISGVVWNFIILNLFYLPRFFQDNAQTTYIRNGVTVTKEEFYSNPSGLLFLVFGFIPIITGIIMLKKKE